VYTAAGPSPEGSSFDNVDLFAFDPATGERTNLTNTPSAAETSFVWSPDGTKVAFQRTVAENKGSSEVVVAEADLSHQHTIKRCEGGCFLWMAWSPDDRRIAWTSDRKLDGGNSVETLEVHDLASGTTKVICDSRSCGYPGQPAWSPDGSTIAFSGAGTYRLPGYLGPSGPIRIADVATGAVAVLTGSGEPCNMVRNGCASDTSPTWSPSGDALAYVHEVRGGTSDATTQMMVVAPDGSDPRVLSTCVSNDQCREGPLAWSPDGRSVAFVDRYDHPVLHLVDAVSSADVPISLPPSATSPYAPVWSPDGRKLAFLSGNGDPRLFLVDVETLEVVPASVRIKGADNLGWLVDGALAVPPDGRSASLAPTSTAVTPAPDAAAVDTASVLCTKDGIQLDTPVVWAQPDGVHFLVRNEGPWWGAELHHASWNFGTSSSLAHFEGGPVNAVSAIAPGSVTVACLPSAHSDYADPTAATATLTIVDPDGLYVPWDLACGSGTQSRPTVVAGPHADPADVYRRIPGVRSTDEFRQPKYPGSDQYSRADRVLLRDGAVVARFLFGGDRGGEWSLLVNSCPGTGIAGA
jgi:Tol biopolymer transport system component